jgi:hypothetical protein
MTPWRMARRAATKSEPVAVRGKLLALFEW